MTVDGVRIAIDHEVSLALISAAHRARFSARILEIAGAPRPGSKFERLGSPTPHESIERRVAGYLEAAAENVIFWADMMAPLKFHSEQQVRVSLRPTFTLARAALEAVGQALWMLNATEMRELQRRYVAIVLWELRRRTLSEIDPEEKSRAKSAETELIEAARVLFSPAELSCPRGYREFVTSLSEVNGVEFDAPFLEQLWRDASGVAHGHHWVNDVMTEVVPSGGDAGRVERVPSQHAIAEVIGVATQALNVGVLHYVDYLGVDLAEVVEEARAWLAEVVPLMDEAARDMLRGRVQ